MPRMKREEWFDVLGDVDWTLTYVDDEAVYPEWLSGTGKVPRDAWAAWDEPYKVAYSEYVATQTDKEASVYAVKSGLKRSKVHEHLDEGWKSVGKEHYGAVCLIEYLAVFSELRMARFGLAPKWRNVAVYGALDEMRHTQMNLSFAHDLV